MTDLTRTEIDLISRIAARGVELFQKHGVATDRLGVIMDLEFCNDDVPLDFAKLLAFPNGDFNHDMAGIRRHFNRDTRKLENCFLPRCARPEASA